MMQSYFSTASPAAPVSVQTTAKTYPYLEPVCFPVPSRITTMLCGGLDASEVDIAQMEFDVLATLRRRSSNNRRELLW
jgi:hypothetical protein